MEREYQALSIRELGLGAGFRRPRQPRPGRVSRGSPALEVMTDLTRATPATIRPQAPIDAANQFMMTRGVRLLLVVDDREVILGLITATDILGEGAMQAAIALGRRHDELTVADLMTPASRIEVIEFEDVETARVGHVAETLRRAGRQHALVVEYDVLAPERVLDAPPRRTMVRGIFSLSQLARQLGIALQPSEVARSFAALEAALGH